MKQEKFVDRFTTKMVAAKNNTNEKIYVEPFPIIPTNNYVVKKNNFGGCSPRLINQSKGKAKNNLFDFYNPKRKGEPFVSRLYTGFDFINAGGDYRMYKPDTAWKYTSSSIPIADAFWSYDRRQKTNLGEVFEKSENEFWDANREEKGFPTNEYPYY